MNIQLRTNIEQQAQAAAARRDDTCHYPHGSEHRDIWVDAYFAALEAKDCIDSMMSAQLKDAVLL